MLRFTQRCRGFTLIELLVVISIIALLLAVMMPALSRARDQARGVVCMAHLKSLSDGYQMYAAEYRGYIAPVSYQDGLPINRANFSGWMNQIGIARRDGSNQSFSYRSTVVPTMFFKTGQILTSERAYHWPTVNSGPGEIANYVRTKLSCPVTSGKEILPSAMNPNGHGYHVTYAANGNVGGWRNTSIRRSSDTVLLTDNAGAKGTVYTETWISAEYDNYYYSDKDTPGRIGRWHGSVTMNENPWSGTVEHNGVGKNNRSFNAAFIDGHVSRHSDEYELVWRKDGHTRSPAENQM